MQSSEMEHLSYRVCILYFTCLFLTLLNTTLICQASEDALRNPSKMLYAELIEGYGSSAIRPVINLSLPTIVYHRLLISQIIEFDEPRQTLTLNSWQRMDWNDEFLTWDPSKYANVSSLEIPPSKIWKPDIHLYENVDKEFMRIAETTAMVEYDGDVTWYTPIITTSSCHLEVRYFPFDTQRCNLSFTSWVYTSDQVQLYLSNLTDATQNVFQGNGVWNLARVHRVRTSIKYDCCPFEYITVIYTLLLTREYEFYLFNMIIPSITLCLTNTLVYLIPPESGEKVQFAVSNLLASILFQQLIATTMPPLGDELPLLGVFFLFMVMISCFSIACSIFSLQLYNNKGDSPVPKSLRKIILITHPLAHRRLLQRVSTMRGARAAQSSQSDANSSEPRDDADVDEIHLRKLDMENGNHSEMENHQMKIMDKNKSHPSKKRRHSTSFKRDVRIEEWRLLARVIDKIIFTIILTITCVVVLGLIIRFLMYI